ncbi:MAG: hypothetical protein K6A92_10200 [Lachnospiraceae bacterium]|nr:hypothetical protein [Lachnospiraceae bacterium]
MKKYYLYVDESGDFEKDGENLQKNPSLVGGLLWARDDMPDDADFCRETAAVFGEDNHATELTPEEKGKLVYALLKKAKEFPVEFVIFENDARARILSGTQTYLTVITEGVLQLLKKLVILEDEPVELEVVAGFKKDTSLPITASFTEGYIERDAYQKRLDEKLAIEKAKAGAADIQRSKVSVRLADDKRNDILVVCDYICNFRYTNPARAFSVPIEEEGKTLTVREALNPLYKEGYIFPLFHTREDDHVLRMVQDGFYADALFEAMSGTMTKANRDLIRESFGKNGKEEIHRQLNSLIGYIGQLVSSRENEELTGKVLEEAEALHTFLQEKDKEDLWFYLDLQLYRLAYLDYREEDEALEKLFDRLEPMIADYTARRLDMDFLLIYYTRKAVYLQNCFRYEESCSVCDNMELLVGMVEEALRKNDLISLSGEAKSDALGKILGTRLQAEIALCMQGRLSYEEAAETSERAMKQFSYASDLHRQEQYRAQLEAVAGHFEQALACMERSFGNVPWKEHLSGPEKTVFDIYNMAYIAAFSEGEEAGEIASFLYQNLRREIPEEGTIGKLTRLLLAQNLLTRPKDADKAKSLLRNVLYGNGDTANAAPRDNRSLRKIRAVADTMLRGSGKAADYFR